MLRNIIFKFLILLLVQSCASYKGTKKYVVTYNIPYTKNKIDHRLQGDYYKSLNKNASLVVLVHGGGWTSRDKGDMDHIAKSLASHGFDVFNINYRLAPKYKHPTPIKNLNEAVEFMKNKYKYSSSQVGLWGFSSGGHTVTYFALKNPDSVKAVVSGGAPYDFNWYAKSPYIYKYLGNYRDELLEEYYRASPVNIISNSAPSFYLYHAINDKLVEHSQTTSFEAKLKRNKIPVKRYDISFWGHATGFIFSSEAIKAGVDYLKKTLIPNS